MAFPRRHFSRQYLINYTVKPINYSRFRRLWERWWLSQKWRGIKWKADEDQWKENWWDLAPDVKHRSDPILGFSVIDFVEIKERWKWIGYYDSLKRKLWFSIFATQTTGTHWEACFPKSVWCPSTTSFTLTIWFYFLHFSYKKETPPKKSSSNTATIPLNAIPAKNNRSAFKPGDYINRRPFSIFTSKSNCH